MAVDMRKWLPRLLLVALILLYAVYFSLLSIRQHDAFLTGTRDLGNMDQPIWNTLHGRILQETRADGREATRFTDHFEPIFIPVSLIFLLWDDVRALLVFQTLCLALGAVPTYWLARDRFGRSGLDGRPAGLVFAAVYLLLPAIQVANLTEFHAAPLAVPLLLFAYYFGRRGDALWLWITALLAMAVKEEVSLLTFMLGLYLVWKGPRRVHGAALAGVSLAWFGTATFVIIPAFGKRYYDGLENSIYFSRYGEFGSGPKEIALSMLREPAKVLSTLLDAARVRYVGGLLASVAFLALFDLPTTLISLPILAANLLSNYPAMYSGEMHYSALLAPFLMAGAIGGGGWLLDQALARRRIPRRLAFGGLAVWVLVLALGYQGLRGFAPFSVRYQPPVVTSHHRLLERFAAQIPPDAPLSTTPPLFPHLSHRERIHQFPLVLDAEYVLLDVASPTEMHPNDFRQAFFDLFNDGFGIVDAADGYILLVRGHTTDATLPDEFYDFVRTDQPQPDYPYQVDFSDRLRFLGFSLIDDPAWRMTSVRTYWEVLQAPGEGQRIYPFFVDRYSDVIEDTSQRPMVGPIWYPSSMWKTGEILQFETMPWDLTDEFTFCLGIVQGGNWDDRANRLRVSVTPGEHPVYVMEEGTWVRLHTFERGSLLSGSRLAPVRMEDEAHLPDQQVQFGFGQGIELLGYELSADHVDAGEAPTLTLYWRAMEPITQDYTVFVHLTSDTGAGLPQADSGPNWRGPMPTTAWEPGQIIPDRHDLSVPAEAAPGAYRISVGLYYWETMERLPVTDASGAPVGDHAVLTVLHVGGRDER